MKTLSGLAAFVLIALGLAGTDVLASSVITDSSFPYTIYVPDNWVRVVKTETHHTFYDTTGTMRAQLAISRKDFSSIDYPKATDWTRAHFIAYKVSVDLSIQLQLNPFGAVLYYDSSSTLKQKKNLWATELYSMFFSVDTAVGSWAEYMRFTASGNKGFEIYAIGDTADMNLNVGFYAAILQSIELPENTTSIARSAASPGLYQPMTRLSGVRYLTLDGRNYGTSSAGRACSIRFLQRRSRILELNRSEHQK